MSAHLFLFIMSVLSWDMEQASCQDASPVLVFVGLNASFSFQLNIQANDTIVTIRNGNGSILMTVRGTTVYTKVERVIFTGNTYVKHIAFILRNVTLDDAGYYTAFTTGDSGNLGRQILIVKASPDKPWIMELNIAESGSGYHLNCSTKSNSAPPEHGLAMVTEWKRNGAIIIPGGRYTFSGTELTISNLYFEQDNGSQITCLTYEDQLAKSLESDAHIIDVKYGPVNIQLSPSDKVITEKETNKIIVNCTADCNPTCSFQWNKEMVPVSMNQSLIIITAGKNNTGHYTCAVNNRVTNKLQSVRTEILVIYPPVLRAKATNTSKGGRVVINCTASGVPDNYTFYKWTHMAPDVSRTIVRELEVTRVSNSDVSLTIEGATYQDTGFYACKASNGITHFGTGQLIMEDTVSVWIADQPIITSNARYFDAEKGKTGYIHIEFYSGVIQPVVTWYLVKNGTMELLQNSSDFGIYLSAVTVEIQYYQKTVQLPGYNACLGVFYVHEEQFTSYKVEIKNSFAEPVFRTLELKSRGSPETPSNLSVIPDSVTTHSLQLTWLAGFHGGASQTFVIEYKEVGKTNWLNKTEPRGLVLYVNLNTTIADLKDGTKYEFRIYSENVYNRSQVSLTINETTKTVPSISENLRLPVAAIAGGISAGLVIIFIMGIGIVLWRRCQHKKQNEHDNDVSMEHEERQSQMKSSSVKKDEASGKEYEGLHFKETEANQYLQLNGITSEENRNTNIRSPESDSYEQLHSYVNNDIQMYRSLKIPKTSKDAEQKYENTWIKKA